MKETQRKRPRTKSEVEAARVASNVAKRHHAELLRIIATLEKGVDAQRVTVRKILARLDSGQKRFAAQEGTTIAINRALHHLSGLPSTRAIRDSAEGVKAHVTDQVGALRAEMGALAGRIFRLEEARYSDVVGTKPVSPDSTVSLPAGNGR